MYCDYPDDFCGAADGSGTCVPRPTDCVFPESPVPTCACDGTIHDVPCAAAKSGSDVSVLGSCEPPANTFACGARFCGIGAEYCRVELSDVATLPDAYSCVPVPCPPMNSLPDCGCVASDPCVAFSCSDDGAGAVKVVCPGG
jgi:hypothetical protein